jgi:hypothetical protein
MQNQLVANQSTQVVIKLDSYINSNVWLIEFINAKASEIMW